MFERYTQSARRALFFAREEASMLGSHSIDSGHLLLALMREGQGLTSRIFARTDLSIESIRKNVDVGSAVLGTVSTSAEISFNPEMKPLLRYAADEADRLR